MIHPDTYEQHGDKPLCRGTLWTGSKGREAWAFTLLIGRCHGRPDVDWASLLPDDLSTGWLCIDPTRRVLTIEPHNAYPDRRVASE